MTFTRHQRTRGDEIKHGEKLIVISLGDRGTEIANALLGD
ncbi:hypothetical protein QO004_004352 [Rhizobium mesoamericanum]|nr:hypothetical protein [Rhizobium mesoamericanum]